MTIRNQKTLTLSGWAQLAEALAQLASEADRYDYSQHANAEEAIAALAQFRGHSSVIGWSLGGQLALRAIAAGALAPKRLVLIAAPARFVGEQGMGPETFALFRESYVKDPKRTKERFRALIVKDDSRNREVMNALKDHPDVENTARWLPWLDALEQFDVATLDLSDAPRTLIVHGMNDRIVPFAQGEMLADLLPHAVLQGMAEAGHAPHLHDVERLRREITAHGVVL